MLGLLVSMTFASADFFGGVASRRTDPWLVVLGNQVVGLVPLTVYLVALTDHAPTAHDALLSIAAGLAAVCGLGLLFGGFAIGRMAVVAPVSAGTGGVVPILWGLLQGERPGALALLGGVVTITAAVVLARSEGPALDEDAVDPPRPAGEGQATAMAVGAGLSFGVILICFSETSHDAGMWPPMIAHLVAIPVLTVGLAIVRRLRLPDRPARRPILGSGLLDATATALLVVALRQDLVTLVAPAANLYPAGTAVLAALLLGERLHRTQVLALVAAGLGLAMLATG